MPKYYKYKTPDDLVADAERLGLQVFVTDDFSSLFTPISIGPHRAGNRLAIQPMEGCDGTLDGHPDELTYRRYRRFGAGGAKLIWGEATAVADEGRMNPRQLWINEKTAGSLERMLAQCRQAHRETFGHDDDLVVGLQLTHSGRFSYRKPMLAMHDPLLDPLTRDKSTGRPIDPSFPLVTDDELKQIADQFLAAAKLAWKIGCDFVDIKQCHRYLLSELLAAKNRPGPYGGSLENRTRLVRDIIERIRDEVPELTIATRINAYDGIPYRGEGEEFVGRPVPHERPLVTAFGTNPENHLEEDLTEPLQLVRWLKDWGVQLINVSMGNPYANPHVVRPAEYAPVDGYNAPEHPLIGVARHFRIARQIQRAVPEIPVVGSGYSWLQDFAMHAAAANVARGDVAIVGIGRGALAHPDFAKTLQETGRLRRTSVCRTFSYCTNLMRSKDHPLGQYPTGCPPFDKEVYGPIWKEVLEKRKQAENATR
ncbi:MAG: NADH:flavin oxidoreductase [Planctomycetes bacterium]|nr:NADH:flavin oxidoreductase [Planctomycetota bacterium]